ncbi:MAG: hypothetical protein A2W91_14045 [Bacteroidetes bacterium GWF2_38_335]|nr:MAG: hypothetical protein A2W91_14045 [Bacteroidetes bacterium GWF2_38_335]OFY77836.1 MAG: hypothetical protein A2281_15735 [Bacteroidetes bacterium RIFOXYA12_FULL_38_20]HBS87356.1 hypothetical protein [Bacteroidales bacterium]
MKKLSFYLLLVLFAMFASCSNGDKKEEANCICDSEWKGEYKNLKTNVTVTMNFFLDCEGKGWEIYSDAKKDITYKMDGDILTINEFNKYRIVKCEGNELKMEHLILKKTGEEVSAEISLKKVE